MSNLSSLESKLSSVESIVRTLISGASFTPNPSASSSSRLHVPFPLPINPHTSTTPRTVTITKSVNITSSPTHSAPFLPFNTSQNNSETVGHSTILNSRGVDAGLFMVVGVVVIALTAIAYFKFRHHRVTIRITKISQDMDRGENQEVRPSSVMTGTSELRHSEGHVAAQGQSTREQGTRPMYSFDALPSYTGSLPPYETEDIASSEVTSRLSDAPATVSPSSIANIREKDI